MLLLALVFDSWRLMLVFCFVNATIKIIVFLLYCICFVVVLLLFCCCFCCWILLVVVVVDGRATYLIWLINDYHVGDVNVMNSG